MNESTGKQCLEGLGAFALAFSTWHLDDVFDLSSDLVIGQCLTVTKNIDQDTTAASCSSDSSAWVPGPDQSWAVLKHYLSVLATA